MAKFFGGLRGQIFLGFQGGKFFGRSRRSIVLGGPGGQSFCGFEGVKVFRESKTTWLRSIFVGDTVGQIFLWSRGSIFLGVLRGSQLW